MERAFWMAMGAALLLMSGCSKHMSYNELDVIRANATNALSEANSAKAKADDLESQVEDLEMRISDLEDKLGS